MKRGLFSCSLILLGATLLSAASTIDIVVSIPPQQEIVEALCDADTEVLIGPGQSPATWTASPRTMVRIVSSSLLIPIGLPFEVSLKEKLQSIAPKLKICSKAVPTAGSKALDPHIWLDPEGAIIHARAIAKCLQSLPGLDPAGINTRLDAYIDRLRMSERKAAELLAPYRGQEFLVYHPAFGHFAKRFHLRQLAIEKDGKAPSAQWMARVIARAQELHIRTIFIQPSFASDAVNSIAEALDADIVEINPLAEDLSANIPRIAERIAASFGKSPGDGVAE